MPMDYLKARVRKIVSTSVASRDCDTELLRNQPPMPREQSLRRDDRAHFDRYLPAQSIPEAVLDTDTSRFSTMPS